MIRQIDQFLTWYFQLNENGPETVSRSWRLEASWNWLTFPTIGSGLILIAVLAAVTWATLRSRRDLPRVLIVVIRSLTIILVAALILQARLKTVSRGRPELTLLIDTSASMSTIDRYADDIKQSTAILTPGIQSPSRLDLVKSTLLNADHSSRRLLNENFNVTIRTFDSELHDGRESPDQSVSWVENLQAVGIATRIDAVLNDYLDAQQKVSDAAVVLVTDGNSTSGDADEFLQLARRYRRRNLPVFAIGVGSQVASSDLVLDRIQTESVGFTGEPHPAEVLIKTVGSFTEQINVVAARVDDDSEVVETSVDVTDRRQSHVVKIELPILRSGVNTFEINVSSTEPEASATNNSQRIQIWGRDDELKVLLIEQTPGWEYRHVRSLLSASSHLIVESFLVDADPIQSIDDTSVLHAIPSPLDVYDVIILSDIDGSALPREFPLELERAVEQAGVGLMIISGTGRADSFLSNGRIEALSPSIPIDQQEWTKDPAEVLLAKSSQKTDFFPGEEFQADLKELPPVYVRFQPLSLQPASETILVARSMDESMSETAVLIAIRYGKGHVVQQLFNDTWRWRSYSDASFFRQYWLNLVQHLGRSRMMMPMPPLRLTVNQQKYSSSETVEFRLYDRTGVASEADRMEVRIRSNKGYEEYIALARDASQSGVFIGAVSPGQPGDYEATIQDSFVDLPSVSVRWSMAAEDPERLSDTLNESFLNAIAKETRGNYFPIQELGAFIKEVRNERNQGHAETVLIPLWNRWEMYFLLLLLLAGEWSVRKRYGMS